MSRENGTGGGTDMRDGTTGAAGPAKGRRPGLPAQLADPPGGRPARIMLGALFVDRTGSGVWAASCVLYFTVVTHLDARQIGLLLGVASAAGIAGPPLAGRLAARLGVRPVLIGCHLLRLPPLGAVLLCRDFTALLVAVAVTALGDRGSRTLEMLFATAVAQDDRSVYRALSRTVMNAGYAAGAAIAAAGLAVGTRDAYRALVLADAVSFLLAAALVRSIRMPGGDRPEAAPGASGDAAADGRPSRPAGPWRDRGYLLFVLLDAPMSLDDSILNVGLPLWLVHRTSAPHALVPAFLAINTVLVVVLQLRVSARVQGPQQAARAVPLYGLAVLLSCLAVAGAAGGGAVTASLLLLTAAVLVTVAELLRSVVSWELAVALAPEDARATYLGAAGMSLAVEKAAGPMLLTDAVMAAGPLGWLGLGAATAGLAVVQGRLSTRRLAESRPAAEAEPLTIGAQQA